MSKSATAVPLTSELALADACILLGASYPVAYRLLLTGRLQGSRRGRLWFVSRESVDAELARMRAHNAEPAR